MYDLPTLRDQFAAAMARRDGHDWPTEFEDDEQDYLRRADAAMAVADRAGDGIDWKAKYELEHARHVEVVRSLVVDRASVLRDAADAVQAHPGAIPYRPQLDEDGGFWWDTRDRDAAADLLRRMADEAQQPEEAGR